MSKLARVMQKRGWSKLYLIRAYEGAQNIDQNQSLEGLNNRLSKLEENYRDYVDLSKALYEFAGQEGFVDPSTDALEYEEKYFKTHSLLMEAVKAKEGANPESNADASSIVFDRFVQQQTDFLQAVSSTTIAAEVPFEKIKIPSFSGNYEDWQSFRDLFVGAIDSKPGLSNTKKFYYLKSYLTGDALALIKHLTITDKNYTEAWARLQQRYDRKWLIVRSYIQSFLSLPSLSTSNVAGLRKIADGADESVRGLNALQSNSRDPWLIHILLSKVDNDTKQAWAEKGEAQKENTFDEFLKFLSLRCDALESCQPPKSTSNRRAAVSNLAKGEEGETENNAKCVQCQGQHKLAQCDKFKSLDVEARRSFVHTKKLCYNCLASTHNVNKCVSTYRCRVCRVKHHTLVHKGQTTALLATEDAHPTSSSLAVKSESNSSPSRTVPPAVSNHLTELSLFVGQKTILPTIRAQVIDSQGNVVECRALLDTGSTVSLVREAFVQRLGLTRTKARIPIVGLSSTSAGVSRGRVSIKLLSRFSDNNFQGEFLVLSNITSSLPTQLIDCFGSTWNQIHQLNLADPSFGVPGPIDILIGCDQLWKIYTGRRKEFDPALPIALETLFGWVIAGPYTATASESMCEYSCTAQLNVDELIRSLMEMDNIQPPEGKIREHDPIELHFANTHSRQTHGTYVVEYPFKEHSPPFDVTLPMAINRLHHLERRFHKDAILKEQYTAFMEEYLNMGHMERIPENEIDVGKENCYYLPHHAVLKPSSSTTKCRVVFDGSCKDESGVSLNDRLHIGPPIQRDLFGVALRFRQHRYVFCADIAKMFRGIKIASTQTNFQRIVWRRDVNSPIEHYRLLTVTYGLAPSPYLAVRVLKQLADDYKQVYPIAACVLERDAYVDDIPTGCDTIDALIALKSELITLLSEANFKLRKWSSNCWPLLEGIPKEHCELSAGDISNESSSVKILGLSWSPGRDELYLNIDPLIVKEAPTKRIVLSELSKIYDPLGFVAPTVILFKILFQETWCLGLNWDDKLPAHLCTRWANYMRELPYLQNIRIPRYIAEPMESIELHAFADASSVACAAVVYSRTKSHDTFITRLIACKTRVAPLKPISIPRMELNAAVLCSRLVTLIRNSLTIPVSGVYCWSDSTVVLHWLTSPPRRWTTFVCNRTAEILTLCPRSCWRHVRSEENPADCPSKGLLPLKLIDKTLWWNGPQWLSRPCETWPIDYDNFSETHDIDILSERARTFPKTLIVQPTQDVIEVLIQKISSWNRLIRVVAYCCRFLKLVKKKFHFSPELKPSCLSTGELRQARNLLLRHVQMASFSRELATLRHGKVLPVKSKLLRYTPFIDDAGILRVGGRLKHADVSFSLKHPILLPKNSRIVLMIIRSIHEINLHPGVDATFFIIRQQFWILGCRNLVRKIIFECKKCFLQRRTSSNQIMGDLPFPRVQPHRCFLHCGVDYAGPVAMKLSKGRNPKRSKAWFAIFVCLSTKALHIEVVSDLTTDAFLAAFRRFCSRRGKPSDLYSDNGTTFRGSKRALDELQQLAVSQTHNSDVSESLAKDGITWHFIPPFAPHFGGLWESGVRSLKLHLRRVIGTDCLTYEEYSTLLSQIESILNSRPLSSGGDNQIDPLTPAHFLIGEPYTSVPEPSLLEMNPNLHGRWRSLQAKVQGFWKRWHLEYLTSLQQRNKWQTSQPNVEVGRIVVLKEPNVPPGKWLLGRIEEIWKGADNKVRVVSIKTTRGIYKRPITRIALLPLC